jgi:serine/threonine protein kinase
MSDDSTLTDLLLRWEGLNEQGQDPTPEQLAAGHPHMVEELRRRIGILKAMGWVKEDERSCCSTAHSPPAGTASESEPPAPVPEVLAGRYRLERLIAEGGFGHVWQGYDLHEQRRVAVKIAKPHRVARPEQVEAFLGEAARAQTLRHPAIVPVLDVGHEGGLYFHVSELIEGTDLAGWVRRTRPTPAQAAGMAAAIARALDHAHQRGIVHRDVKPANVLVDAQGRPFITDFGIAVTTEQLEQQLVDCSGTLAYMAPEQAVCDASRIDPRSDVYAVGVLLYEMLAGRPPFRALTPTALREQILSSEPPPLPARDDPVPAELVAVCRKCLAKTPADRYQTAGELAEALEAFLSATTSNL